VGNLVPCNVCGRKFNEDRIAKHSQACSKATNSKRKTFNAAKARLQGVAQSSDDARLVAKALASKDSSGASSTKTKSKSSASSSSAKANKWKKQSQALREAMKYNRQIAAAEAAGVDIKTLAPPPASQDDDLVPCPHCGRTFNEKAAERHIPRCQDQKAKPSRLVRGGGTNASTRRRR
jgi:endogenous inhibitor of DNA gyrase (YacG/DUF329 family)